MSADVFDLPSGNVPAARTIVRADQVSEALLDCLAADYRAGVTLSELSEKYRVAYPVIYSLKRKHGWRKDLRPQVRAEVQARLAADDVAEGSPESPPTEDQLVEAAAARGADVVRAHRTALGDHLATLGTMSKSLTELAKALTGLKPGEKLPDAVQAAAILCPKGDVTMISVAALNVANAYARVVPLHRRAYGLDEGGEEKPYEDRLKDWAAAARKGAKAA